MNIEERDDLRRFYKENFSRLDDLMKVADWPEVCRILLETCQDESLRVGYGIGLIRFCSGGKKYIEVWNTCLDELVRRGADAREMRGIKRG